MTKKDFELIAAAIRYQTVLRENNVAMVCALNYLSRTLANSLAGTNPRFDRTRFLEACGVDAGSAACGVGSAPTMGGALGVAS